MITQQYKYQLAKRGKWLCPECGRKTFVCYVDANGQVLDESVGKCDRADKCAYHYPPRQYFEDNKVLFDTKRFKSSRTTYRPQPRPIYIPPEMFEKSCQATMTHKNNLIDFLKGVFSEELVNQMITQYYIGTSKHFGGGATVFYQVDQYGKIHRGKVMQYNPTNGKRVKEPYSMVTTVHKLLNLGDNLPPQCLFGEHLLSDNPNMSVAIVESEKTAIIASSIFGDCITLACGGCGNLTSAMCEALRGRDVILFPDNGKYDEWREKGKQMRQMFGRLRIASIMEQEAMNEGDDIGDLLLQRYLDVEPIDFGLTDLDE